MTLSSVCAVSSHDYDNPVYNHRRASDVNHADCVHLVPSAWYNDCICTSMYCCAVLYNVMAVTSERSILKFPGKVATSI